MRPDGKVFRVQDAEGRGPWRPGFSQKWVIDRPDHDKLLPWYIEFGRIDQKVLATEYAGSACRTLKQLRRWFTKKEYKKLIGLGYRAVMLDVDRIIAESDIQCFVATKRPLFENITIVRLYP